MFRITDGPCQRHSNRNQRKREPALTIPLSYTGTSEGLDRELGKQLVGYVESHQQLGSTLAQVKARPVHQFAEVVVLSYEHTPLAQPCELYHMTEFRVGETTLLFLVTESM